jgi:glycosyltransferase involved in cell wall biosynthesis
VKVALITPWENAWIPYFKKAIQSRGHEFLLAEPGDNFKADVVIHGWSSGVTQPMKWSRNIFFLRRYELFSGGLKKVNWKDVDALIVVNSWIMDVVRENFKERGIETPVHLIYNGTDLSNWKYKERKPGNMIGMACHVHPKKNLPLALQILAKLPEDYELHIAGEIQDACTAEYLNHLANRLKRKIYLYGHIPREHLDAWWDQMNYCLSTSLSEGNPNNVIEAMAKGIKPVIHSWPGSEDQFPQFNRFNNVDEAVKQILELEYTSGFYREWVSRFYGLENYNRVLDIAEIQ